MDDFFSFDEFGNPIGGPSQVSQKAVRADEDEVQIEEAAMNVDGAMILRPDRPTLAEEKQLYPDAVQVYTDRVEVLIGDADTRPLSEPTIAPPPSRAPTHLLPPSDPDNRTEWTIELLSDTTHTNQLSRRFIVAGGVQCGKTTLMDLLLQRSDCAERYLDARHDEQQRRVSVTSHPIVFASKAVGRDRLFFACDTPGALGFHGEVAAAARMAEGMVLVVDIVEGASIGTKAALRIAALEHMPVVLVLNKIDRLALELRLPPADAYLKIAYVLAELNTAYASAHPEGKSPARFSPLNNNVIFASAAFGMALTLQSVAAHYARRVELRDGELDEESFVRRLWGDVYYSEKTRKYTCLRLHREWWWCGWMCRVPHSC